jgi:hypothetical protein
MRYWLAGRQASLQSCCTRPTGLLWAGSCPALRQTCLALMTWKTPGEKAEILQFLSHSHCGPLEHRCEVPMLLCNGCAAAFIQRSPVSVRRSAAIKSMLQSINHQLHLQEHLKLFK